MDDPFSKSGSTGSSKKPGAAKSETPVLDNFGIDITKAAEEKSAENLLVLKEEMAAG